METITIKKIKNLLAQQLNIDVKTISFLNDKKFLKEQQRYLYTLIESHNGKPAVFVKIASPDMKKRLYREFLNWSLALELEITDLKILFPYQNLNHDYAFYGREQIDMNKAIILASLQDIKNADPILGKHTGEFMASVASQKIIPDTIDLSLVASRDYRNRSIGRFWKEWFMIKESIFLPEHKKNIEKYVNIKSFEKEINNAEPLFKEQIKIKEDEKNYYFVHNDTAPSNMYFIKNRNAGYTINLVDFEFSGATHNRFLALVTDAGNIYGRLWPNPTMQKEFLKACVNGINFSNNRNLLMRLMIIFNTIYFLNFYFKNPNITHERMIKSLLENFFNNLEIVDKIENDKIEEKDMKDTEKIVLDPTESVS
ncbi:MAG: hypothetical protein WCW17_03545 [Patescibacteria group bacterium]